MHILCVFKVSQQSLQQTREKFAGHSHVLSLLWKTRGIVFVGELYLLSLKEPQPSEPLREDLVSVEV